jgi:pullulanase/glycogen debranching enzyme
LTSFIAQLTDLRRELPALRHADWFTGLPTAHATDATQPDIAWMDANGQALSADAWNHPHDRTLVAAITVGEPGQPATARACWWSGTPTTRQWTAHCHRARGCSA